MGEQRHWLAASRCGSSPRSWSWSCWPWRVVSYQLRPRRALVRLGTGRPADRAGRRTAARGPRAARRRRRAPAVARPGRVGGRRPGAGGRRRAADCCASGCSGGTCGVLVTDLSTGRRSTAPAPPAITPASTTKLLTSTAALETLGPDGAVPHDGPLRARVPTSSCSSAAATRSWPAADARPEVGYPDRADVRDAGPADRRASCARRRSRRVRLAFDDSYFTGPAVNPAWPAPTSPRTWCRRSARCGSTRARTPTATASSPTRRPRPRRPSASALAAPASRSRPQVARGRRRPPSATEVASVSSAPLGRDRRAHPRGQRQPGRRGAGPPRRPGRAAGGLLPGGRRVGARGAAPARRTASPATGCTTAAGSPATNRLTHRHPRRRARGSPSQPGPPELRQVLTGLPVAGFTGSLPYRFDKGPDEARGPGAREDRDAHRGARTGGRRRRRRAARGWPSWWSPTGSRPLQGPGGADADRPDRRRAGRVHLRRRVDAMSAARTPGPARNGRLGPRRPGGVPARRRGPAGHPHRGGRGRRGAARGAERSTPLVREFTGLVASERTAPVLVVDRPGLDPGQRRRLRHRDRAAHREAAGEEGCAVAR